MRILVTLVVILVLSSFIAAKALILIHQEGVKLSNEIWALHSEHIAELDASTLEVNKTISSVKEDISTVDQELESINNDLSGIQSKLVVSRSSMDHAVEEAGVLAAAADQATLDKYSSSKVDVAVTQYKNSIPYQKDIYTHAEELSNKTEDTVTTEVISL